MERAMRRCAPPPGAYPWLVYFHGRGLRIQTFCTISKPNNNCVRNIPELRNRYVWNCCHGWVILSDEDADDQFHLWNPVTSESVRLPQLELNSKSQINDCILSSPPGDPRSTILLLDRGLQSIWFCCLEDKQWIQKRYSMEIKGLSDKDRHDYLLMPVCCDGKFYATTYMRRKLVLIELIKPNGLVITSLRNKLPFTSVQLGPLVRWGLVESCGELFCIFFVYAGINHAETIAIEISRLDFSSMVWFRVDCVRDRVFFLDGRSSYSCSAGYCSETEGNRVYFFLSEDKSLYSYNIEDGSILVSLPCQNLPTPWKEPIWLMPGISDALINAPKEERSKERGEVQEEERDSLCVCKDGWLMMCKSENFDQLCMFFFNPFTKEIIQYPDLPRVGLAVSRLGFSSAPTSSNCVVVVATFCSLDIYVYLCRSREEGWLPFSLESDSRFGLSYNVPISINNSFYILDPNGKIGILRFEDEDDCSWEVKNIQKPCNSFNQNFLTECNGELISVFVGTLGKGIKIFKLNTSTMVWDRVKSLGNYTLYLSRSSVLSAVAKTPEMTDKIYFPRFRGQQHLVSYSLSSCKYQSSSNEDSFHDFYGTREPLTCGWIEPRWS